LSNRGDPLILKEIVLEPVVTVLGDFAVVISAVIISAVVISAVAVVKAAISAEVKAVVISAVVTPEVIPEVTPVFGANIPQPVELNTRGDNSKEQQF